MNNLAFVPFNGKFFAVWGSDGCAVTFTEAAFLQAMRRLSHVRAAECSTEEEARSLAVRMYGGELVHRHFSREQGEKISLDLMLNLPVDAIYKEPEPHTITIDNNYQNYPPLM